MSNHKSWLLYFLLQFLFVTQISARPPIIVNCVFNSIIQPPLLLADSSGLAKDLVDALNQLTSPYHFNFQLLPTNRLRQTVTTGENQIALFNNIDWGWNPSLIQSSVKLLHMKELYITQDQAFRDQAFFNQVGQIPTIGVLGFNYRFTHFESDIHLLRQKYLIDFTTDEISVIKMIHVGHGEIGIVNSATLAYLKKNNSPLIQGLLISEKADNEYDRTCLISKKSAISVSDFNRLLEELEKRGTLNQVFEKYGLTPIPFVIRNDLTH